MVGGYKTKTSVISQTTQGAVETHCVHAVKSFVSKPTIRIFGHLGGFNRMEIFEIVGAKTGA